MVMPVSLIIQFSPYPQNFFGLTKIISGERILSVSVKFSKIFLNQSKELVFDFQWVKNKEDFFFLDERFLHQLDM